ncbi:MAG: hypothetical protein E4H17_02595 [Gemmatimonadales bacterium]|nr:MAG: hypothetical protein E4H17_02595 [Gemmatimonadales bacterium]
MFLLKYRKEPADRNLVGYVVFVSLAVLCHYSAALAFGVFALVVALDGLAGGGQARTWRRFAFSQAIPAALAGSLYVAHVRRTLQSDLMAMAFEPGGWLTDWLVASPADVWHSFVTFQNLQLPPEFQGRSALVLLAAIAASVLSRDRLVAVLAGSALSIALLASFLGVYPFGPTRHSLWLLVFTLPAMGWLVGQVVVGGSRAAFVTVGVSGAALLFGGQIEERIAAYPLRNEAMEERTVRRRDLAPLVVEYLGPAGDPRTILMSGQSYNMMMPLYALERRDGTVSADSMLFSFKYGTRDVVVSTLWDWQGPEDVARVLRSLPAGLPGRASDSEAPILLMAGGFDSELFRHISELEDRGAILRASWAVGPNPYGPPFLRLGAMVIDGQALMRQP